MMFSQQTMVAALLTALPLVSAFPAGTKFDGKGLQQPKIAPRVPAVNTTVTNPKALEWYEANPNAGIAQLDTSKHCYGGMVNSLPSIEKWGRFDAMWESFSRKMPNSPEENQYIKQAIEQISHQSKVDRRVILSMIMQESGGDVRVKCTAGYNCGLLQGPHGTTGFDPSSPQYSIYQMVAQSIMGTQPDNGFVAYLNMGSSQSWTNNPAPGNVYTAFRIYNSGKVISDNLDNVNAGTASYVNDIANRLHGWNGDGGSLNGCSNGTAV